MQKNIKHVCFSGTIKSKSPPWKAITFNLSLIHPFFVLMSVPWAPSVYHSPCGCFKTPVLQIPAWIPSSIQAQQLTLKQVRELHCKGYPGHEIHHLWNFSLITRGGWFKPNKIRQTRQRVRPDLLVHFRNNETLGRRWACLTVVIGEVR